MARASIFGATLASRASASPVRLASSSASQAMRCPWMASAGGAASEFAISSASRKASAVSPRLTASFASSTRMDHSYHWLVCAP